MSKQQWKLLVCSIAALTLLVMSLFVIPWFDVNVLGTQVTIDLRSLTVCGLSKGCATVSVSGFKGFYPIAATAAFFVGIPVLVIVVVQSASRIVTGTASSMVSKLGYAVAMIAVVAGFGAGFLFAPDSQGVEDISLVEVSRTWAPILFLVGNLLAMFSLYLAAAIGLDDDVAEYKPIKLDKHEHGRLPVTPLSVKRVAPHGSTPVHTEAARRFTPSQGVQRVDDNSKRYTPGGSAPLEDDGSKRYTVGDPSRRFTPSQGLQRVDDPNRRFTPSQQIRQIEDAGRTKSPTQPPTVSRTSSPGLRPRRESQQPRPGSDPGIDTGHGAELALESRRTRAPSEHGLDAVDVGSRVQHLPVDTGVDVRIKQRPPSEPSIEVVKLAPSTPAKRPSDPSLVEVRIKSPTQQPLVARTASPGVTPGAEPRAKSGSQHPPLGASPGSHRVTDPRTKPPTPQSFGSRSDPHHIASITDPRSSSATQQPLTSAERAKSASQQLFAARNASPGERPHSPTQQPLVARTASPGVADPRAKSGSQQPLVARTASPGLPDPRAKSSQQPLVARTTSPGAAADPRTKSASQQPLVARTASPGVADPRGSIGIDPIERSRTSSSGPIDLKSRLTASAPQGVLEPLGLAGVALGPPGAPLGLSASPVEVSIRPPLPQPEPIPDDQIPVDPAAGLTIRKRTQSAIRLPAPSLVDAPSVTTSTFPPYIQNKISYAIITAELSTAGITATREDGSVKMIAWDAIVGVIARRLPAEKPYEGATIVDIVSEAGATIRVVPWTRVRGGLPLAEAPVERAREIVNLVAAQALSAKLDAATKLFADSDGQAVQLPTLALLTAHDERLA